MKTKSVEDIRDYFILAEVEYCFDNNYGRCDEVIHNEYDSLNKSYQAFSKYSIEELIEVFGDDIVETLITPWYISDNYKAELFGFITNCKTASDEDKRKGLDLVSAIIENNHTRNMK